MSVEDDLMRPEPGRHSGLAPALPPELAAPGTAAGANTPPGLSATGLTPPPMPPEFPGASTVDVPRPKFSLPSLSGLNEDGERYDDDYDDWEEQRQSTPPPASTVRASALLAEPEAPATPVFPGLAATGPATAEPTAPTFGLAPTGPVTPTTPTFGLAPTGPAPVESAPAVPGLAPTAPSPPPSTVDASTPVFKLPSLSDDEDDDREPERPYLAAPSSAPPTPPASPAPPVPPAVATPTYEAPPALEPPAPPDVAAGPDPSQTQQLPPVLVDPAATQQLPPVRSGHGIDDRLLMVPHISADLLPTEIVYARKLKKIRKLVISGLTVFVVLLGLWFAQSLYETSNARDELAQAQDNVNQLTKQQTTFGELVKTQADSKAINDQLKQLFKNDLQWSTLYTTLQKAAPDGVGIEALTGAVTGEEAKQAGGGSGAVGGLTGGSVKTIGTITVTGNGKTRAAIATYVDALGKATGVTNPLLSDVGEGENGTLSFTIKLDITEAALGGRFTPAAPSPSAKGGK
jgi:Tfp pilus assembly protein PilN